MGDNSGIEIRIGDLVISRQSQRIHFTVECWCDFKATSGRLRLSAVFESSENNRCFPVVAVFDRQEQEKLIYRAQVDIQTAFIFYEETDQKKKVAMYFIYDLPKKGWQRTEILWRLDGELFVKRRTEASGHHRILNRGLYAALTLCLPFLILDGCLAMLGIRRFHPAAEGRGGIKAAFYHAQGIVKDCTGFGYSIREWKTDYFCQCYQEACLCLQPEDILLLSERRPEQGGNLMRIREALDREGLSYQSFLNTKTVNKLSRQELKEAAEKLASAKLVILEDFYPQLHALSLRHQTKVLQLWHACGAFKLFGLSELGIVPQLKQSTPNHRSYTAAIVSSESMVPIYSEAFGIPRERVFPVGVPRTDLFFDRAAALRIRHSLYQKYPGFSHKKAVLFAPTFRGSGNRTAYYPMERFPLGKLMEALPEDYVLIIKQHPFVKNARLSQAQGYYSLKPSQLERIYELSDENINDLLFVTDILMTDYSSVIFEAVLLKLPCIFYVFDRAEYLRERDLYFEFERYAPGGLAETPEELVDTVKQFVSGALQGKETGQTEAGSDRSLNNEDFCRFFLASLDGASTKRTMELIKRLLDIKEKV